jgi:hypothetical protein
MKLKRISICVILFCLGYLLAAVTVAHAASDPSGFTDAEITLMQTAVPAYTAQGLTDVTVHPISVLASKEDRIALFEADGILNCSDGPHPLSAIAAIEEYGNVTGRVSVVAVTYDGKLDDVNPCEAAVAHANAVVSGVGDS